MIQFMIVVGFLIALTFTLVLLNSKIKDEEQEDTLETTEKTPKKKQKTYI